MFSLAAWQIYFQHNNGYVNVVTHQDNTISVFINLYMWLDIIVNLKTKKRGISKHYYINQKFVEQVKQNTHYGTSFAEIIFELFITSEVKDKKALEYDILQKLCHKCWALHQYQLQEDPVKLQK